MDAEKYLRIKQVLESVPVSKSTIWQWVKDGKFPAPIKLGPATTCWKLSDVRRFLEGGQQAMNTKKSPAPDGDRHRAKQGIRLDAHYPKHSEKSTI